MKKAVLVVAMLMSCPAFSQEKERDVFVGISAGPHFGFNFFKGHINSFLSEYNAVYSVQLTKNFSPLRMYSGTGFTLGFSFITQSIYYKTGATFRKYGTGKTTALFADGTGREISLYISDTDFNMDIGVRVKHNIIAMALLGASWRQSNLISKRIYPDGTYSLDNQYLHNGSFYNIDRPFFPFAGIGAGYLFKGLLLQLRMEKQMGAWTSADAVVEDHQLKKSFNVSPAGTGAESLKAYGKGAWNIGFTAEYNLAALYKLFRSGDSDN